MSKSKSSKPQWVKDYYREGNRRPWEGSRNAHVRVVGRECSECFNTVRHADWCKATDH